MMEISDSGIWSQCLWEIWSLKCTVFHTVFLHCSQVVTCGLFSAEDFQDSADKLGMSLMEPIMVRPNTSV